MGGRLSRRRALAAVVVAVAAGVYCGVVIGLFDGSVIDGAYAGAFFAVFMAVVLLGFARSHARTAGPEFPDDLDPSRRREVRRFVRSGGPVAGPELATAVRHHALFVLSRGDTIRSDIIGVTVFLAEAMAATAWAIVAGDQRVASGSAVMAIGLVLALAVGIPRRVRQRRNASQAERHAQALLGADPAHDATNEQTR